MPAVTGNRVSRLLAVLALAVVAFVLYKQFLSPKDDGVVKPGAPITEPPRPDGVGGNGVKPKGFMGLGGMANTTPERKADADSPAETLRTLTAEWGQARNEMKQVIEENKQLRAENTKLRTDQTEVVNRAKQEVLAELRTREAAANVAGTAGSAARQPAGTTVTGGSQPGGIGSIVDSATSGAGAMIGSLGRPGVKGIPGGLGYDDATGAAGTSSPVPAASTTYKRILPVGVEEKTDASNQKVLVRAGGAPVGTPLGPLSATEAAATAPDRPQAPVAPGDIEAEPYFTIPENATLTRGTLMTALVGRVPVDGRVQDPVPFKILIGRENLAANGQYVPDDISGAVVSGIAIGDMTMKCSSGFIQSFTFIFNDGTIRTVSLKKGGASTGFAGGGGAGGGGAQSIGQLNKLAWISDEFGNPCIDGMFVTNAPATLTDTVGLKTLSIAAKAAAMAQTTTNVNPLGATTSVTGNKQTFVLGEAASAGVDEVSSWIMRRLNNSFDAVVTRAGGRVVLHIEQDITIDKPADGRKLDYARAPHRRGARGGLD